MKISKKKLFLLKSYSLVIFTNKNFFKIQKKVFIIFNNLCFKNVNNNRTL